MKTYLVGGAVRDGLLGLPVAERDWLVVGADDDAMRAAGFLPVDAVFPVYRHPQTGEEYALARRETKRGEGYRGFEVDAGPDVTLEEDLRRRDLTINAMVRDAQGEIIDLHGGREDLDRGLLRHVTPAFTEDPVRVVRVARFAAKLGGFGFRLAHDTHRLMCTMADDGTLAHLRPERLWREMIRAMACEQPWRFFEVLHRCGALRLLIPALAIEMGEVRSHVEIADPAPVARLKRASALTEHAGERLVAALLGCVDTVSEAGKLARDLRADRDTAQLMQQALAVRDPCRRCASAPDREAILDLAMSLVGRAPDRAEAIGRLCAVEARDDRVADALAEALVAGRAVSPQRLAAQGLGGTALGEALGRERRRVMRERLSATRFDN